MPEAEEMVFWLVTCFTHPLPHHTYIKYIWGSELVENRYFSFLISEPTHIVAGSASDYKPRKVYGWDMGPEWDEVLREYWIMRDYVRGVRKASAGLSEAVPGRFPGPDPLLKIYDSGGVGKKYNVQPEPQKKLKLLLPPCPPTIKPKWRRRPSDPEPLIPLRRNNAPALPPTANPSGRKVYTQPIESQALANARALYKEVTPDFFDDDDLDELVPDNQLRDRNGHDSEEDADGSDDDDYVRDEDEDMCRAIQLSKQDQADRERRRDSGGGDVNTAVAGPAPKEEKDQTSSYRYPQPETNRLAGLPFPVATSIESSPPSMPPPPSPRPSSSGSPFPIAKSIESLPLSMLPPPPPPPSPSVLPPRPSSMLPPPSPRPSSAALPPPPQSPRPPPSPLAPPLSPFVPERKRRFRVIDLDADPDLDEDSDDDDGDGDEGEDEDEDSVMEDVDAGG
jgi:hypothetical protein